MFAVIVVNGYRSAVGLSLLLKSFYFNVAKTFDTFKRGYLLVGSRKPVQNGID